jgi:hypothetical protein
LQHSWNVCVEQKLKSKVARILGLAELKEAVGKMEFISTAAVAGKSGPGQVIRCHFHGDVREL